MEVFLLHRLQPPHLLRSAPLVNWLISTNRRSQEKRQPALLFFWIWGLLSLCGRPTQRFFEFNISFITTTLLIKKHHHQNASCRQQHLFDVIQKRQGERNAFPGAEALPLPAPNPLIHLSRFHLFFKIHLRPPHPHHFFHKSDSWQCPLPGFLLQSFWT